MRGIVERAVESVRPLIERRRHELSVSLPQEPIWLHADPTRLEQVVVNLLNNAAKYTDEGGRIWLTVQQRGKRGGAAGAGHGRRHRPRAAAPHLRPVHAGGTIAGPLARRVGHRADPGEAPGGNARGTVKAHSEGLGARERVQSCGCRWCCLHRRSLIGPRREQPTEPTRTWRVLVVDDNVDTADDDWRICCRSSGHDVRTAYTGPAALEAAVDYRPDVVLLDIGLPGLNGYEVARRLAQNPQLKDVRLVAMTGYGQKRHRTVSRGGV